MSAFSRYGSVRRWLLALLLLLPPMLILWFANPPWWLLSVLLLVSVLTGCCCQAMLQGPRVPVPDAAAAVSPDARGHVAMWRGILPLWRENLSLAVLHNEQAARQLARHLLSIHTLLHSIQGQAVDEPVSRAGVHLGRMAEAASQLEVLAARGQLAMNGEQHQAWLDELQNLAVQLVQDARHARQSLLPLQAAITHPETGWPQPFFSILQQAAEALQQALVVLQTEDKVSQIISQVINDQQALLDFLQDHPEGMSAGELENWLFRFRESYTTDEQRAMAMVSTNIKPGRSEDGITYF